MSKKIKYPEGFSQSAQEAAVFQQKVFSPAGVSGRLYTLPDNLFHFTLEKRLELIESIICSSFQ